MRPLGLMLPTPGLIDHILIRYPLNRRHKLLRPGRLQRGSDGLMLMDVAERVSVIEACAFRRIRQARQCKQDCL